jgi:hypothetical protein
MGGIGRGHTGQIKTGVGAVEEALRRGVGLVVVVACAWPACN